MWAKRLVLALAFGGSITLGMNVLKNLNSDDTAAPETGQIVVAKAHIDRGKEIEADMIETMTVPKNAIPPGAVADADKVLGRLVTIDGGLPPGTILEAALASADQKQGLPSLIPIGMRAFTIQASNASGVAGLVSPEDRVDVLLTVQSRSRDDVTGGGQTMTLLQNIEVLTVNQDYVREDSEDSERRSSSKKSRVEYVTLLVAPEQAVRLNLAQSRGSLHLSLRNPDSIEDVGAPIKISFNDILDSDQSSNAAAQPQTRSVSESAPADRSIEEVAPKLPAIVTYRGTRRTDVKLSGPIPATAPEFDGDETNPGLIPRSVDRPGLFPSDASRPDVAFSGFESPRRGKPGVERGVDQGDDAEFVN
jgi:pilus assembly protein CpaB